MSMSAISNNYSNTIVTPPQGSPNKLNLKRIKELKSPTKPADTYGSFQIESEFNNIISTFKISKHVEYILNKANEFLTHCNFEAALACTDTIFPLTEKQAQKRVSAYETLANPEASKEEKESATSLIQKLNTIEREAKEAKKGVVTIITKVQEIYQRMIELKDTNQEQAITLARQLTNEYGLQHEVIQELLNEQTF